MLRTCIVAVAIAVAMVTMAAAMVTTSMMTTAVAMATAAPLQEQLLQGLHLAGKEGNVDNVIHPLQTPTLVVSFVL